MMRPRLAPAAALALMFAAAPALAQAQPGRTLDARERREAIDSVLAYVREAYVFPERAAEMERDVRARQRRGDYDEVPGAQALADSLTAHLRAASRDRHVSVQYIESWMPEPRDSASRARVAEAWRRSAEFHNAWLSRVERLDGNVGYLRVDALAPPELAEGPARAAMDFLANTDALILDLRDNQGTRHETVALLTSWLLAEPRVHLGTILWRQGDSMSVYETSPERAGRLYGVRKPMFVLTSGRTWWAAEGMAYQLAAIGRATVVGERTGGGAHPLRGSRTAPNFLTTLPAGRWVHPVTNGDWEGTGVRPHVAAPAPYALAAAHRLALQAMLPLARHDEYRQAEIRRALERLGPASDSAAAAGNR